MRKKQRKAMVKVIMPFFPFYWEKLAYVKFGVLIADILAGTLKHFLYRQI